MSDGSNNQNRRILVIDDNRAIHGDFRKILGVDQAETAALDEAEAALFGQTPETADRPAFEMDSAYQGQEGLDLVRRAVQAGRPYALAFVDVRMPPGWDGVETTARLWGEDPHLQTVLCTAYSDYSWEETLRQLGSSDRLLILKKPFDGVEVQQLAFTLTQKWDLARQARVTLDELEKMVTKRTLELRKANQHLESEIARRKVAEERLRRDALYDSLTNLPNRSLLMSHLSRCVERAKRNPDCAFAVLFLDIDNFKVINDSLGHRLGDELLIESAKRLAASLRSLDTVVRVAEDAAARLGGDEFVILLEDIRRASDAVLVAERIQEELSVPFQLDGRDVAISVSIGIVLCEGGCEEPEELLRNADTAMYRAKQAGKGGHAVFNETMHVEALARLELENALRSALDKKQFQILYQPIVLLETGRIESLEALLRWRHPDRGVVSPGEFIPMAEEMGLIVPIGRWVLQEACGQLRVWNQQLPPGQALSISVNVSKRQLVEHGFCGEVERILGETGLDARHLNLEITESAIIGASESVNETLRKLKTLGVQLHMDDFGTGYSSLSCLHRIPFDVLKIDRAFIRPGEARREYAAVIHAIITLARNLKMRVTAEGIETREQLAGILALGCDYAQGHYFSRPVDASTAQTLMAGEHPWPASAPTAHLPAGACEECPASDGNDDADLSDFRLFQRCFRGTDVPADPSRAD
jgi:diguanylate cyclase (GGDEF)-like protein